MNNTMYVGFLMIAYVFVGIFTSPFITMIARRHNFANNNSQNSNYALFWPLGLAMVVVWAVYDMVRFSSSFAENSVRRLASARNIKETAKQAGKFSCKFSYNLALIAAFGYMVMVYSVTNPEQVTHYTNYFMTLLSYF